MTAEGKRRRIPNVPTLVDFERDPTEAECFVRQAFGAAYDAHVEQFLPSLMTLRNDSGHLVAVLGLRHPDGQRFYLEQYLDRPLEQVLRQAVSCPVEQTSLIEVGNFAVGAAGGGRWLITALTAYLYAAGHCWAVFTSRTRLWRHSRATHDMFGGHLFARGITRFESPAG